MGVGVRTPSAFLINPAFPSPCRARYIFVKDVVFDKRNRVSEADPRSFAACKHFFFFNAWLFRTSRDLDRSGAFS